MEKDLLGSAWDMLFCENCFFSILILKDEVFSVNDDNSMYGLFMCVSISIFKPELCSDPPLLGYDFVSWSISS